MLAQISMSAPLGRGNLIHHSPYLFELTLRPGEKGGRGGGGDRHANFPYNLVTSHLWKISAKNGPPKFNKDS